MSLTLSHAPDFVSAGNSVSKTITFENNGPSNLTHVSLTDDLPDSATNVVASSSQGTCEVLAGNLVSCVVGSLPPDGPVTVTVMLTPAGSFENCATAQYKEGGTDKDPPSSHDDTTTGCDLIEVVPAGDPDREGGCASSLTTDPGTGVTAANPIVTTIILPEATCVSEEEVFDPTFDIGCPEGVTCVMPQYIELLTPDFSFPPGTRIVITIYKEVGKVRTLYIDEVEVPRCPRRGLPSDGKCVKSIKTLSGGHTEITVLVASDAQMRG